MLADERVCRILEFGTVRQWLDDNCVSPDGRRCLQTQGFHCERPALDTLLRLVGDYCRVLREHTTAPVLSFPDIASTLDQCRRPGSLCDPNQLLDVARYLRSARGWREYLLTIVNTGALGEQIHSLPQTKEIEQTILWHIDEEGEVREEHAPELKRIAKQIRRRKSDIRQVALRLLRDPELHQAWNAEVPTLRDERVVLPLRSNWKGRIEGIVHEASDSGATLFFEPSALITRNNELREYQSRYQHELRVLLRSLSETLRAGLPDVERLVGRIGWLDTIRARALYAKRHHCVDARGSERVVDLRRARHPLIPKAVPIDLRIDGRRRGLLITGPNTGGKTVALKTIGLLALMNQFGMHIPVDDASTLPLFRRICVDIGDEQSLQQSLSTFSAHMRTIGAILDSVDEHSLVLLDELGAGTDPQEGAALAMAILDHCLGSDCVLLVSSHHGALKEYGYREDRLRNASVEFDQQTLSPTYRLLLDLPGSSHALDIAGRVGIPQPVVQVARRYAAEGQGDVARVIERLISLEATLHNDRRRLDNERRRLDAAWNEMNGSLKKLQTRERDLEANKLNELDRLISQGRRQIEALTHDEHHADDQARQHIRQEIETLSAQVTQRTRQLDDARNAEAPPDLRVGIKVRMAQSNVVGIVRHKEKNNRWQIETPTLRLILPAYRLIPLPDEEHPTPTPIPRVHWQHSATSPTMELDLRGLRLNEAEERVRAQIDRALAHNIFHFGIIHGTGEGILKNGIRELLRTHPSVTHYAFASPEDGGFGKTIVTMDHPIDAPS